MKIGFVGLGNMGSRMAANLVNAGHTVAGFDVKPFDVAGVLPQRSAAEAAAGKDVIITMLPDGNIMRRVVQDIVSSIPKSACLVDCSTIDIASARAVHTVMSDADILSVDAPVSGGIGGAAAGTLTIMVGGSERAFDTARPVLANMGSKIIYCGHNGSGQAAKICNNMLLGISMIGVCEAFNLADKLGLERQKLFDVASGSSGSCWSLTTYCPAPGVGPNSPADNGYQPGFAAELMLKDLVLAKEAAVATGAATPLGTRAALLFEEFVANGGRGRDFSAMLPHLKQLSETP